MDDFDPEPAAAPAPNRLFHTLAAVGAGFAALYWAALTAMLALAATSGSVSPAQVILPCVLIGLYAYRGFQLLQGNTAAAQRLIWLHVVGGIVAIAQIATGAQGLFAFLQAFKVAIHIFGGITAFLAARSLR
jgi:hypothetical protein